ncbi:hypothetical protein HDU93_003497, partial [Gonapodya sp. JEL0774]
EDAEQTAQEMRDQGWDIVSMGNAPFGTTCVANITTTTTIASSATLASTSNIAASSSPVPTSSPTLSAAATGSTNNAQGGTPSDNNGATSILPIIGGAAAGVAVLVVILIGSIYIYRRRKRSAYDPYGTNMAFADRVNSRKKSSFSESPSKPPPAYTGPGVATSRDSDGFQPVKPLFRQLPPTAEYPYPSLFATPTSSTSIGISETLQSPVRAKGGPNAGSPLPPLKSAGPKEETDPSQIKYPNIVLAAIAGYRATNPDEISIREGDEVFVKEMYPDVRVASVLLPVHLGVS